MPLEIPPDLAERKKAIKDTHRCPYCDNELAALEASSSPMGGWGPELLYLCLADDCPYYVQSRETLAAQGIDTGSYRFAWEPERDWCGPIASTSARITDRGAGPSPAG